MKAIVGAPLGALVDRFMRAMHRYDGGRTLPILHAAKLTTPQLAVLEFTREPQTVSLVAVYLGLSRPAASQLVDKLVRGRLVRRMESAVDRRERNVVLTARGRALVDKIAAARAVRFNSSLAALPPPLRARFQAILSEVIGALGETAGSTPETQSYRGGIR
jgi:DNA-binding MarR family transcriptional regulator